MEKILTLLEGKKTYILAVVGAIINLFQVFGVTNFTPEQLTALNTVLVALFGLSLKAGVTRELKGMR